MMQYVPRIRLWVYMVASCIRAGRVEFGDCRRAQGELNRRVDDSGI
jgi:hypothetical protein